MFVFFLTLVLELVLDRNSILFVTGGGESGYKASGCRSHTADYNPSSRLTYAEDLGKGAHKPPFLICMCYVNNKSNDLTMLLGELNELLYLNH